MTTAAYAQHGRVAVITLANPPVNALGQALRRHIADSLAEAESDTRIEAIVLTGSARAFSAGADVREFGKPPQPPSLPEVCNRIEACSKPVVAAVHGVALGGGLELALAAHYRLAVAGTKVGLPEVQLGLLPGAGGTQRLPRIIGVEAALEAMLSGRQIGADEAHRLGLFDRLASGTDAMAAGLAYAEELLAANAPVRRTRDAKAALADAAANRAALDAARAATAKKIARPLLAAEDRRSRRGRARPAFRRRTAHRARAVPAVHRQPAAPGPDPCLLRRARSRQGPRDAVCEATRHRARGRRRRRHDGRRHRGRDARRRPGGDDGRARRREPGARSRQRREGLRRAARPRAA